MRRTLLLFAGVLLAGAAVAGLERLDDEWQYQHLLIEGHQRMVAGDPASAVAIYSGAITLRPESMLGHYRRGEAHAARGNATLALGDFTAASRLAPDAPEPREAIGRLYARAGNHRASALWYGDAVGRRPDADPRLLYALSLAYYRTGALGRALEAIESALTRDPSMAAGYYLQGLIARDLGQVRQAVSSLEYALRLDGSLVSARHELASLHQSLGHYDRQAAELERLRSDAADPPRRAVAAALAYLEAGDTSRALTRLGAVAGKAPGDSAVALALARAQMARATPEALEAARETLERALGGTASRSEGLALYGRALHLAGRFDEAERLLFNAVRTTPVHPPAFLYLAEVAQALGHPLAARDALIALTALEGSTLIGAALHDRYLRIGVLSLNGQDSRAAITYLRRSHRSDAPALAALAEAYWMAGEPGRARTFLDRLQAEAPDRPDIARLTRLFE